MRNYYISYKGMHWRILASSEEQAFKIWQAHAGYYKNDDLIHSVHMGTAESYKIKALEASH